MSRSARWIAAAAAVVVLAGAGVFLLSRYGRAHAMSLLKEQYGDRVEVANLDLRFFPSISATAGPIVVRDSGTSNPLISIAKLSASAGWLSVFAGRISRVELEGLKIDIPPRHEGFHSKNTSSRIHVAEVVANGAVLRILPRDSDKPPLEFDIHRLTLHNAGAGGAMSFDAALTNAKPPGEIHSTGTFGPWNGDDPAETPVAGQYTFRDADLGVFKGIRGKLASDGKYEGVLDRIEAQGHTDVPDFALAVAGNAMHLSTDYQATIDGTNGNVYLHPVRAMLANTPIETSGVIERLPGTQGRLISLDGSVTNGRLQEILELAVKSKEPPMTGLVSFKSKIVIPPGDVDVIDKLQLDGAFVIDRAHFSELSVQEKVNDLSHRGRGEPEVPKTASVASDFEGRFKLDRGVIMFSRLAFQVPGIHISLDGTYGLRKEALDFHGTASLQAKLSETTTGFKSVLLKAVDGFFKKKNAGAVVPIKITGTVDSPSFGLSLKPAG